MKLFSFEDDLTKVVELKKLGFTVEVDDEVNQIMYCEYKPNDYYDLSFMSEECYKIKIEVFVDYKNKFYLSTEFLNEFEGNFYN
jgi:hypothetical protein